MINVFQNAEEINWKCRV